MVKATSSSVPVPVDITQVTTPVVEKPKAKRAPKKEPVVAPAGDAPVSDATAVLPDDSAAPVDVSSVDKTDVSSDLSDEIAELLKTVQARSALDITIKASIKSIEKKVARMTKLMEKCSKKRKSGLAKVSGF